MITFSRKELGALRHAARLAYMEKASIMDEYTECGSSIPLDLKDRAQMYWSLFQRLDNELYGEEV